MKLMEGASFIHEEQRSLQQKGWKLEESPAFFSRKEHSNLQHVRRGEAELTWMQYTVQRRER